MYCIGGILFEKKIGSGNWSKHDMWNQTMNKEEKVEACKTLNHDTWWVPRTGYHGWMNNVELYKETNKSKHYTFHKAQWVFTFHNGASKYTKEFDPMLYGVWWHKMCFFSLLENLRFEPFWSVKFSLLLFELFSLLDGLHLWIINKINNYIIHKQLDNVTSFNFGFFIKKITIKSSFTLDKISSTHNSS